VDNTQLSVAVWRPADQWQTEDEAVALRLKHYRRNNRLFLWTIGVPVLFVLIEWIMGGLQVVAAMCLVALVVMVIIAAWHQLVVGRWLPTAETLLATSPRRRLAACVMAHRPSYTVLGAGDMYLRVRFVNRGLRQVIARSGEITVIGPDANGNAVVFVDGWPIPLPARVAAPTAQAAPEPTVDPAKWFVARQAGVSWLCAAGASLLAAGFIYDAQQPTMAVALDWLYALLFAGVAIAALASALGQHRLSRLLTVGQWLRYPAALASLKGESRRPYVDLTLHVSLQDGRSQKVVVRKASPALMANVYVTGTLWVVGPAVPGRLSAVGVPGHPIVAAARFA
jgi:hypothetical protein